MTLENIIAITGKPGLYELEKQTRTGFLAKNIEDGKRITATMRHEVSSLDRIAIYAYSEEVLLGHIFNTIHKKEAENNGKLSINPKKADNKALATYFREILPEFDEEQVYPSVIKKVLKWYTILKNAKILPVEVVEDNQEETEA
jgi:hypothetical protein